VVLVITEDCDDLPPPGESEVQPLLPAAQITAVAAAARAGRTPLIGTAPTLTSGQVKPSPASPGRSVHPLITTGC